MCFICEKLHVVLGIVIEEGLKNLEIISILLSMVASWIDNSVFTSSLRGLSIFSAFADYNAVMILGQPTRPVRSADAFVRNQHIFNSCSQVCSNSSFAYSAFR